jgi:hypothetical protein
MSKKERDDMFLKVGIPEGTASNIEKEWLLHTAFPCRVFIEDHMAETEAGCHKPWHRIAAFLPFSDRTLNTTAKWAQEQAESNSLF